VKLDAHSFLCLLLIAVSLGGVDEVDSQIG
jgi:hypothetical protein